MKTINNWRYPTYSLQSLFISAFQDIFGGYASYKLVVLDDLGITCSPRDLRLAGSNPGEVDVKVSTTSSPGDTLSCVSWVWRFSSSLKNLKPEKIGIWGKFNPSNNLVLYWIALKVIMSLSLPLAENNLKLTDNCSLEDHDVSPGTMGNRLD